MSNIARTIIAIAGLATGILLAKKIIEADRLLEEDEDWDDPCSDCPGPNKHGVCEKSDEMCPTPYRSGSYCSEICEGPCRIGDSDIPVCTYKNTPGVCTNPRFVDRHDSYTIREDQPADNHKHKDPLHMMQRKPGEDTNDG